MNLIIGLDGFNVENFTLLPKTHKLIENFDNTNKSIFYEDLLVRGWSKIIAGENSAPGVISLIASCEDQKLKKKLNLNSNSNVLVIGCEGDTDQEMYQKLINQN